MKKYELVLVMDPATSDADRKSLLGDIQKSIIEGKVENTDDIGMMNLKYDL
jgi:ribosomal protein S6